MTKHSGSSNNVLQTSVIEAVRSGDESAILLLDAHGLPPAPEETREDYAARLERLRNARNDLQTELKKKGSVNPASGIRLVRGTEITPEIIEEALEVTERLYAVRPDWVPGYFVTENFGLLWGGCSLSDPESGLNLFIIRKAFQKTRRWLIYDRRELLSHELCHAAHQALNESRFEEYFAYRTAQAPLRRWFGNCFLYKYDAWLFLLPIMVLPIAQFLEVTGNLPVPMPVFWYIAGIYPLFLLVRNFTAQAIARKARIFLRKQGVKEPDAVLFRLTCREIRTLSAGHFPEIRDLRKLALARLKYPLPKNNGTQGINDEN